MGRNAVFSKKICTIVLLCFIIRFLYNAKPWSHLVPVLILDSLAGFYWHHLSSGPLVLSPGSGLPAGKGDKERWGQGGKLKLSSWLASWPNVLLCA